MFVFLSCCIVVFFLFSFYFTKTSLTSAPAAAPGSMGAALQLRRSRRSVGRLTLPFSLFPPTPLLFHFPSLLFLLFPYTSPPFTLPLLASFPTHSPPFTLPSLLLFPSTPICYLYFLDLLLFPHTPPPCSSYFTHTLPSTPFATCTFHTPLNPSLLLFPYNPLC